MFTRLRELVDFLRIMDHTTTYTSISMDKQLFVIPDVLDLSRELQVTCYKLQVIFVMALKLLSLEYDHRGGKGGGSLVQESKRVHGN